MPDFMDLTLPWQVNGLESLKSTLGAFYVRHFIRKNRRGLRRYL